MIAATRRVLLAGAVAMLTVGSSGMAWALDASDAKAHVEKTLKDLNGLLREKGTPQTRAPKLQRIMETRANMPLIAKFAAARIWRGMSDAQKSQYSKAFSHFVAVTYSRRFDEYSAEEPEIVVSRTRDVGRKGILVESPIKIDAASQPVIVEWLVSDRGGKVEIVDMVIEGISMAITLRDELDAMYAKRGRNVDTLITDLANAR